MPNPRKLKVGDRVRFFAMPDEWSHPQFTLSAYDRDFMKAMIKRQFPSRIYWVDDFGYPWIKARIKQRNKYVWHSWGISETTGWRQVKKLT